MTLQQILDELEDLKNKAELNSIRITDNGVEILPEWRAKSQGYADGYNFCIFRLKEHIRELE